MFIPVIKTVFSASLLSSLQCHMILHKSLMMICCQFLSI